MNSLSWLIYLSQMVENLGVLAVLAALFGGAGTIIVMGFTALEFGAMSRTAFKTFCWIMGISIPVIIFVPSQKTLMLIAASQYGEMVAKSPQVAQIVDPSFEFLKTFIEKETKKLKESK